jgi:hypothetical protein
VRGWLGDRVGRDAQGCFDIAPTGGNISVGPYSSTAVPLMGPARMPRRSQQSRAFSGLDVRWIFKFGSGSTKAEHGPLIVPGKRKTWVIEKLLCRQIARLLPIKDRLDDIRREIAEADEPSEIIINPTHSLWNAFISRVVVALMVTA